MDRLVSMTAFVKAVDVGSFAAAASALGLSPQMIAKHVTYLETRLGARLLNRTTRRQSVTEAGQAYYERCKAILLDVEAAESLAEEARAIPRGRLRINAPVSFGTYSLVPFLTDYLRCYPEVAADLVLSDRLVDVTEEGFEVVFRTGFLADSSLKVRELLPFERVVCASPAYLSSRGMPATPSDLAQHDCLIYMRSPGASFDEWHFSEGGREQTVSVKGRLWVNNAQALLAAALDGFGIALVAADLVRGPVKAGDLVRILDTYEVPSRPMHLLYSSDKRQTLKVKSFIDAALERFGP